MRRSTFASLASLVLVGALTQVASAAVATITVTPASAPNVFGSPSWTTWVSNAVYAQINGLTTYGAAGPTQYNVAPSVMNISDNVVTGFNSWQGVASPSSPYASELGNRLQYGIYINGNGNQISISQLSMNAYSTDPGNTLAFSFGTGSYNYSNDYQGILAGTDNTLGTFDDVYITSGPNTQLVDAIVGRGSGNAWAVYTTDPGATLQDKLDNVSALYGLPTTPFLFTMDYSLTTGETGSASIQFNTPEPASLGVLGAGALLLFRRRRSAK